MFFLHWKPVKNRSIHRGKPMIKGNLRYTKTLQNLSLPFAPARIFLAVVAVVVVVVVVGVVVVVVVVLAVVVVVVVVVATLIDLLLF